MRILRRLYRIPALLVWLTVMPLLSVPYQLGGGWKNTRKIMWFTHMWNKGLAKILGIRISVSGPVPGATAGLVVSNHLGYLDIIAHGSVLPVRYSPKKDIASWPILGWYLGLSRPVWVDRQSKQASAKALKDFALTMKNGMFLIVYPEGTSTDGKNGILGLKSTPFEAAIVGNAPIIPVLTRYREKPGEPTACWYGDMTLVPHFWQVLGRRSIDVNLQFLDPILPDGRSRKELAQRVHGVMTREYTKN
jgi:lyso-ornithine lipid O-acyltransferase